MGNVMRHAEMPFPRPHARVEHDVQSLWLALGRALFGGYFVYSGIHHFVFVQAMAGYAAAKPCPHTPE